jgi:23S rRNA pseudouridine2605 synthase
VRALFESRDMKVSRMTQVMFGGIELPRDLPRMRHRELTAEQVTQLYALARIAQPVPPAPIEETHDQPRAALGRKTRSGKLRGPAPDRRKPKRKRS